VVGREDILPDEADLVVTMSVIMCVVVSMQRRTDGGHEPIPLFDDDRQNDDQILLT
jgi:hypothetical protein